MPMNNRLLRPASRFLLDRFPGATVAYSLRRLRAGYVGPVVRVRRSSDSGEADFTAGHVSDGSLSAWVGAGSDGFVRTWYDQSLNARHAGQTIAARQPRVVSNGSLVRNSNGRPAMSLSGSGLAPSEVRPFSGDYAFFGICEPDLTTSGNFDLFNGTGDNNLLAFFKFDRTNSRVVWFLGDSSVNSPSILTSQLQPVTLWSGLAANGTPNGTGTVYRNGSQVASGTSANWSTRTDGLSLFSYANGGNNTFIGTASEFVFYSFSQAALSAIQTEMMRHYSI